MSDTVLMEHPDLGPEARQTVTRKAFELAWSNSGWFEVEDSQDLESDRYPDSDSSEEEE